MHGFKNHNVPLLGTIKIPTESAIPVICQINNLTSRITMITHNVKYKIRTKILTLNPVCNGSLPSPTSPHDPVSKNQCQFTTCMIYPKFIGLSPNIAIDNHSIITADIALSLLPWSNS